jgi:hypothetical protein
MSMNPDDRIVNLLSHWLARHVGDEALGRELAAIDTSALSAEQGEALEELRAELATPNGRGALEMVVRETLEAIALG